MMSGAPCPVELMKRVLNEMHCGELVIAYGQTETSPVVTMSDADDTIEIRVPPWAAPCPRPKSRCLHHHRPNPPHRRTGRGLRPRIRGYEGLRRRPEGTAQVIHPDGWLHTGDLGIMHDDGCIHLTGRSAMSLFAAAKNIYPREVEEFLYNPPQGGRSPSGRHSQRPAGRDRHGLGPAASRRRSHRRRNKKLLQGQIAYYKIPEHVRFVDDFLGHTSRAKSRNTRFASSKSKPAAPIGSRRGNSVSRTV